MSASNTICRASEQQELWLVETQASLQDETMLVATLTAGLDDALRNTSDQYSNFTRQLEYMRRVFHSLTRVTYICAHF